jgi:hypothetical protein
MYHQGKPPPFGAEVVFEIKDTVVEGHEDGASAGSHEFLVFQSVLEKAAAAHGLHPVRNYQDPRLEGMFAEVGVQPAVRAPAFCAPSLWHPMQGGGVFHGRAAEYWPASSRGCTPAHV